MASTSTRRPLPALIALLALLLLTALVWWRVSSRDSGGDTATATTRSACPSASTSTGAVPAVLPAQRSVDVQVLNATTRAGLAGRVRDALLQDGFRSSLKAGNDPQPSRVTGTAQIRYSAQLRPSAVLVHYYFPDAQLVAQSGSSTRVVVSLGPKYAGIVTQQQVTAKLAADHVRIATSPGSASGAATGSSTASPSASPSTPSSGSPSGGAAASC